MKEGEEKGLRKKEKIGQNTSKIASFYPDQSVKGGGGIKPQYTYPCKTV